MSRLEMDDIPRDFPVVPVAAPRSGQARAVATCGECGLSWDDTIPTQYTPTPGGRCPFEAFHEMDEPDEDDAYDLVLIDAEIVRDIWAADEMSSVYRNRKISEYVRGAIDRAR